MAGHPPQHAPMGRTAQGKTGRDASDALKPPIENTRQWGSDGEYDEELDAAADRRAMRRSANNSRDERQTGNWKHSDDDVVGERFEADSGSGKSPPSESGPMNTPRSNATGRSVKH